MNPLEIRGAATPLAQRQTPHNVRTNHRSAKLRPISPKTNALRVNQNQNNQQSSKNRLLKPSPSKVMTLGELRQILKSWEDPEPSAKVDEATEKILSCHRKRSDTLDLSFLGLSTLPDIFETMHHILYMSIANNAFSEMPWSLQKLTSLKLLNISNNHLLNIPDSVKEFQRLEWFNSECNRLQMVTEELGRLPNLTTLMLAHNRIVNMPENIRHIQNLTIDDQVPLARFADFSPTFAAKWDDTFCNETMAGCFEIWLARFQQILRLSQAKVWRRTFQQRIGALMDVMAHDSDFRQYCFVKAQTVITTSHDGILFSLYSWEVKHLEQRIAAQQLTDPEVRQAIEGIFNFRRLQYMATLHALQISNGNSATEDEEIVNQLESILFFYISPENKLEMPLGHEIPYLMYESNTDIATDDDVRRAVEQIQKEKDDLGSDYLVDFILDEEFWTNYLLQRYKDYIEEHRQCFMNQLDMLEEKKWEILEIEYITKCYNMKTDNDESERTLLAQLTKNILMD